MILRRVIQHFLKQEWTAIGIDFLIVVVGVFVGLQANSWNEEVSARREYELALERHRAEASANLDDMRALAKTSEERIEIVRAGLDALLTCEDSAENRRAVEAALGPASGSLGVAVRMTALNELTGTPTLLAQQSEAERQLFSTMRYQIEFLLREADFLERLPLMERLADSPLEICVHSIFGFPNETRDMMLASALESAWASSVPRLLKPPVATLAPRVPS